MVFMAALTLTYSPPNYNLSCNSLFQGTSIQLNWRLITINIFFSNTLLLLIVTLLPINSDKIITVADDGINVLLGLQVTAYQMKTVTIISVILSIISNVIWYLLYGHNTETNILPKFCLKYFRHAPLSNLVYRRAKELHLKDLDVYKDDTEEVEAEVEIIECTHL